MLLETLLVDDCWIDGIQRINYMYLQSFLKECLGVIFTSSIISHLLVGRKDISMRRCGHRSNGSC